MKCPECNHINPDGARFCAQCGTDLDYRCWLLMDNRDSDIVLVKCYNDANGKICIPSGVTSIDEYAFCDCSGLTSIVVDEHNPKYDSRNNCNAIIEKSTNKLIVGCKNTIIPNSVTSIGSGAFWGCADLMSITIPSSVKSIGWNAFCCCSGLKAVSIPNSVKGIGIGAFSGCSGLTSVTIPNSVNSIGSFAFSDCSGLTSVTIGNGVRTIGDYAFRYCSGLKSITIPESVTNIAPSAFDHCSGLTSVTINTNALLPYYDSDDNRIFQSDIFGDQVKEYVIGESVMSIGSWAFEGCSDLTSITIPNSVVGIGNCAFSGCSGLTSITIPESVKTIDRTAFYGCSGLTSISVASSNKNYDSRNNCNAIIETATNTLFVGCKNSVIPNSVASIGSYAFRDCSGLTSVTIPESVTSIGSYAFRDCSGLTSVTILESVTSIGSYAFCDCSGLTSVTIPDSVTNIGNGAFSGCSNLSSLICLNDNVPKAGDNVFENVLYNKTILYVPASVLDAYKSTPTWNWFRKILPLSMSLFGEYLAWMDAENKKETQQQNSL